MREFYQVYQAHAPSGGVSAVDGTEYATIEEARGAAEALTSGVDVFDLYDVAGQQMAYPAYWAQGVRVTREEDGVRYVEWI